MYIYIHNDKIDNKFLTLKTRRSFTLSFTEKKF